MPDENAVPVLVVDDDPRSRELMGLILGHAGYRVLQAGDAGEAMSILEHELPVVVLADLVMPGMSGMELCAWIRATPRLASVRCALLTGMDDEATRRQAGVLGVDDVMTKPFDRLDLLARIARLSDTTGRGPRA